MSDAIFSFGTLRVQAGLFGRAVPTVADALLGFRLGTLEITDPGVIRLSVATIHPSLERTASVRVPATLASGRASWVSLPR